MFLDLVQHWYPSFQIRFCRFNRSSAQPRQNIINLVVSFNTANNKLPNYNTLVVILFRV